MSNNRDSLLSQISAAVRSIEMWALIECHYKYGLQMLLGQTARMAVEMCSLNDPLFVKVLIILMELSTGPIL